MVRSPSSFKFVLSFSPIQPAFQSELSSKAIDQYWILLCALSPVFVHTVTRHQYFCPDSKGALRTSPAPIGQTPHDHCSIPAGAGLQSPCPSPPLQSDKQSASHPACRLPVAMRNGEPIQPLLRDSSAFQQWFPPLSRNLPPDT